MLTTATAEFIHVEGQSGRGLWWVWGARRWCSSRRRASLAPGRQASRVAYRQEERPRRRVKRARHAVDKSRKIVDQLALSLQPGSRQLLAGARPPRDVLRHRLPPDGKIVEIPSHKSKPNPRVLADIIAAQGYPLSDVAYVGDSLAKDILMAKRAGCFAIWAKYGAHTDKQMYDSLVRISHWTAEDIQRERNYASEAQSLIPDFVCQRSLEELLTEVSGPASFAVSSR